ncbi:hypothetical protein [Xanthomonas translucens]|uniref:hypothetical protein n=1 Tax=Xanthomonas campestris pv. translucens TaxID=343 RepID=UPI000A8FDCD0|nr:hypothetical protein [Xanthomonas translucens]
MSELLNHAFVTPKERNLYRRVAQGYTGAGRVVDAGCFAGGTTTALCEGIEGSHEAPPVIAIDRFIVADPYIAAYFAQSGMDIRMGDSFLPIFLSNIKQHLDLVEVRAGDIFSISRIDQPIEILSIDIAKSASINSYLIARWFPLLVPGASKLIHQDFYAPSQPWLAASMALLIEYFRILEPKVGESACFQLDRPIPASAIQTAASLDWRTTAGVNAFEQLEEALGDPYNRSIRIMKAKALLRQGRQSEAQRIVEGLCELEPIYEDEKWMQWLGMALATIHPSMFSSKQLIAQLYDDDIRFRLGHW